MDIAIGVLLLCAGSAMVIKVIQHAGTEPGVEIGYLCVAAVLLSIGLWILLRMF